VQGEWLIWRQSEKGWGAKPIRYRERLGIFLNFDYREAA